MVRQRAQRDRWQLRCLVGVTQGCCTGVEELKCKDAMGRVPFHWAARNNGVAVLQYLIEIGGAEQLQLKDKAGCRPIHLAGQSNPSVAVLQYLIEI
eukprot:COSAG06_NODE_21082_length_770_cov_0.611028_2_plen_95_part_01